MTILNPLIKNRAVSFITAIVFVTAAASCHGNRLTVETRTESKVPAETADTTKPSQVSSPITPAPQKVLEKSIEISNSGGTFQLKNTALLRSSIVSCFGPDVQIIRSDMLIPQNGVSPPVGSDGRIRFLLPTYRDGDDIIEVEKISLVDPDTGSRSAVTADSLTATYLRSLSLIGDVVAHNCSAANPLCACDTPAAALEMLSRCVPSIDPKTEEARDASLMLSSVCSSGEAGMRRAVSSLISSYSFGLSR